MKKKLFLLTLSIFLIAGCGKIPKLKNGEDAVITFKNGDKISVNELYNALKTDYALDATINLMDTKILEKEFKGSIKEAKKYAEDTIKSMKESYGGDDELLQAIQIYTGYSTIDAYQNYIYINYLKNLATEKYAKIKVDDKQVEKYFNDVYVGDVSINHILITPSVKSEATDEEKTKAENEAKNKALEVIAKLDEASKAGKDVKEEFTKLAKEYSDDDATKNKGGELGYINFNNLGTNYDELVNAALKLKKGEYSTKVITTDMGYHVIYKVDQKDKGTLKDAEDKIRTILSQSTLNNDATVSVKAMQYYRDKYGAEIVDSDIQSQYSKYMNQALNQDKTNSSNKQSK